jgi:hypothetical protein
MEYWADAKSKFMNISRIRIHQILLTSESTSYHQLPDPRVITNFRIHELSPTSGSTSYHQLPDPRVITTFRIHQQSPLPASSNITSPPIFPSFHYSNFPRRQFCFPIFPTFQYSKYGGSLSLDPGIMENWNIGPMQKANSRIFPMR